LLQSILTVKLQLKKYSVFLNFIPYVGTLRYKCTMSKNQALAAWRSGHEEREEKEDPGSNPARLYRDSIAMLLGKLT
jgi:hypothetical protein